MQRIQTVVSALVALLLLVGSSGIASTAYAQDQATTSGANGVAMTVRGDAGLAGIMPGPDPSATPGVLWEAEGFTGRGFAPLATGDVVIAMADERERTVVALDSATGEERWRMAVGRRLQTRPAAAIADGVVYVAGREQDDPRRPIILALDAKTGAERWRLPLDTPERLDEWHIPLVADGIVYIAATNGQAFALDAATGDVQWQVDAGNVFESPALGDGRLFYLIEGGVLALDAATGEEQWLSGPAGRLSVATDGNAVYVMAQGQSAFTGLQLHVLDAQTGDERWTFDGDAGLRGEPASADGVVYVAGLLELYALDAATGEIRWRLDELFEARSPAVIGTTVFVPAGSDFLALDGATGDEVWRAVAWSEAIGGGIAESGPAIVDSRIFVYGSGGVVALA